MAFWIAIAVLTAAATIALLAPLYRTRAVAADKDAAIAIYRDQLGEIDRDLDRGVLVETEAKAARTEIARRLLQAEDDPARAKSASGLVRNIAVLVAMILIPAVALGGYLFWGEPNREDLPIASRVGEAPDAQLLARLEIVDERLARVPDDVRFLNEKLAITSELGLAPEAAAAYLALVRLQGGPATDPTGDLGAAIGLAVAQIGEDPETALTVLTEASRAAPENPRPLSILALIFTDAGMVDAATAAWEAVLAVSPEGEFADAARERLAALGVAAVPAQEPDAIEDMTPEEQAAFIEQMVAGLAERLATEPDDPEGWAQLIRSYIVLGRTEDARAALDDARAALADDEAALAVVEEAAQPLEQTQ